MADTYIPPNVPLYLTPDDLPSGVFCRTFGVPDNPTWNALVDGALTPLMEPEAWRQLGSLTPQECADAWRAMLYESWLGEPECVTVPAPFWDTASGSDAGEEMPATTQIWYGEIVALPGILAAETAELTFLDNLGIWGIAAFIAYAGQPGAALAFVPIAKQFVLQFKSGVNGGIVHILADFLHLADIDTYGLEDRIVQVSVVMPDDATTLYVEMAEEHNPAVEGSPQITVIRKELSPDQVSNPGVRYNSDCNCLQISPDGGTTWNDAPGIDPRFVDAFRKPHRTGTDRRCDAAANALKWIKDYINSVISLLDAGATLYTVVTEILRFLELIFGIVGGDFLLLIIDIAGALVTLGSAAMSAAFAGSEFDLLQCIFYCRMDADGLVDAAAYTGITSDVTAQLNATAAFVVNTILNSQGQVGISNAGAIGSEVGDCTSCACAWCYAEAFPLGTGTYWTVIEGTYDGVNAAIRGVEVATDIFRAQISFDFGTTAGLQSLAFSIYSSESSGNTDAVIDYAPGCSTDYTVTHPSGDAIVTFDSLVCPDGVVKLSIASHFGAVLIRGVTASGSDVNPFPISNC